MMQLGFESVWTFWTLVGMIPAFLIVLYLVSSKRLVINRDFREDIIPLSTVLGGLAFFVLPLIIGETVALFATSILYPHLIEGILWRGFTYYVLAGILVTIVVFGVVLSNRRTRKAQETSEDP